VFHANLQLKSGDAIDFAVGKRQRDLPPGN
jgi:hypothetical protein